MTTSNHPKNQQPHGLGQPVQIISDQARERIEELIDSLDGANITATVKALNGLKHGSYTVKVKQSNEWNEIQVTLLESGTGYPIATGFVDRGHTKESRFEAASEARALIRAYLCR